MKLDTYRIKLLMAEREMTQAELAALSGISRQSISTIFGRGTCTLKTAGKLAKGLGVSAGEIAKEAE